MNATASVPPEIQALIAEGLWPQDGDAALKQNLAPSVSAAVVRRFAPEESIIFFYPPPFVTVRRVMEAEKLFWSDPRTSTREIDPDRTVLIGDFGLGSDAPIALDYRGRERDPAVIRLRWAPEGNHWVEVAPNLATFAAYLRSKDA